MVLNISSGFSCNPGEGRLEIDCKPSGPAAVSFDLLWASYNS